MRWRVVGAGICCLESAAKHCMHREGEKERERDGR